MKKRFSDQGSASILFSLLSIADGDIAPETIYDGGMYLLLRFKDWEMCIFIDVFELDYLEWATCNGILYDPYTDIDRDFPKIDHQYHSVVAIDEPFQIMEKDWPDSYNWWTKYVDDIVTATISGHGN